MFYLFEYEIDAIAGLSASVNLALFGISFGALVAFAITLLTVHINEVSTLAAFVALTAVSTLASMFFGIRGALDHRSASKKLKEIRQERGEVPNRSDPR